MSNTSEFPNRLALYDIMREVDQSVKEIFSMRGQNNHETIMLLKNDSWTEFQPGAYCRPIPVRYSGLSMIEWDFTDETLFDFHDHESSETVIMIRGKIDIYLEDGTTLFSLDSDCNNKLRRTGIIPAGLRHKGTCSANSIIITKYVPALIEKIIPPVERSRL